MPQMTLSFAPNTQIADAAVRASRKTLRVFWIRRRGSFSRSSYQVGLEGHPQKGRPLVNSPAACTEWMVANAKVGRTRRKAGTLHDAHSSIPNVRLAARAFTITAVRLDAGRVAAIRKLARW